MATDNPKINSEHTEAHSGSNKLSQRHKSPYTRRRVIGSEQEYGIWTRYGQGEDEWRIEKAGFQPNGSRVYIDCDHPEYASAEASNPLDALLYDKAGEVIVKRKVKGNNVFLFKNNTDGMQCYASHENYSLSKPSTDPSVINDLINTILPFLTSRIIFAGSGLVNQLGGYTISQRADFIYDAWSNDTNSIFDIRREPLADERRYTRLHVVSGDGNLSEPALFLKYGTTALVLDLFEDGLLEPMTMLNPVRAFHRFSEDLSLHEKVKVLSVNDGKSMLKETDLDKVRLKEIFIERANDMIEDLRDERYHIISDLEEIEYERGKAYADERARLEHQLSIIEQNKNRKVDDEVELLWDKLLRSNKAGKFGNVNEMTAVEIQRIYLDKAESAYRGRDDMTDDILNRWKYVLDALEDDPMKLDRWLDWVIKKRLIDSYTAKTGKSLDDPAVRNINLQYHDINRSRGLFYKLQSKGFVDRVVTDKQIEHAADNPPEDTRAWIRGKAVSYGKGVKWNIIEIGGNISSRCRDCPMECREYEGGVYIIDDPLHNYSELEDEVKQE